MDRLLRRGIEVFSTCPSSATSDKVGYMQRVADVARWSERAGCRGILVYTDNSLIDPWLISQIIVQSTERLSPLVAIQPIYMHPYSVAKMVTTFGHLHERRFYLNMVAGGFKNDLLALNDSTPHDRRYDRLQEYTRIIMALLAGGAPVTFHGEFYKVENLILRPPLSPDLLPGVFLSGSSEAGLQSARATGATAIHYPGPPGEVPRVTEEGEGGHGIRVGIIARQDEERAWDLAHARFPEDRKGQITHQLAMKVTDSVWHRQLSAKVGSGSAKDGSEKEGRDPYWLIPFQNYKTFCPYLVGSYSRVAGEVARYVAAGYRTFILDIPPDEEELSHIGAVFGLAAEMTPP